MRALSLVLFVCMAAPALADVPPQTAAAAAVTAAAASPATQPAPASATSVMPAPITCQELKAFKDKLHKAIDAALQYPAELSFHAAEGVTIVGYDYQDSKVSGVHITQPSNDSRLDRTALKAVKNADYASITPGIGPLKIHDSVIIIFDNSANSEKGVAEQKQQQDPTLPACN
jgi:TonB family protein